MILDRDRTHTQRQTGLTDSTNFSLGYVRIPIIISISCLLEKALSIQSKPQPFLGTHKICLKAS